MAPDLFPGFSRQYFDTPHGAKIFVRAADQDEKKPPLLLIHGYPQTHVTFHKVTPYLQPHFRVVLVDLRGYGASSIVPSSNGSGYTKRLMAEDCISVMAQLGYDKFTAVGHDRGARVAYRLAFDHPEKLHKIAVLDIIPTAAMFRGFGNATRAVKTYHWLFLAQAEPFPERMIVGTDGGRLFLEHSLASWSAKRDLHAFDADALELYREAYCSEERIHSTCEDYRAGAFLDRVYDEEDLANGKKIETPLLALWGNGGLAFAGMTKGDGETLEIWREYAKDVSGRALACGHFIPEEDPKGLADALLAFLKAEQG
jgi:haloacetate dehalogenase